MFSYIAITAKRNKIKHKGLAMQDTKSILNQQDVKTKSSINSFMCKFEISKILNKSKISKIRGISVSQVITSIMELPFIQKSFFQGMVENKNLGFNKSVVYDLLNNNKYNWRLFLLKVVSVIINSFIKPLTNDGREDVLIIDDSSYSRDRSKKVELLARVFDHATMRYFKGFRLFQLGWSDGNSFLPVDLALMSSPKKSNRYQEMNTNIDKRSCGYKRRKEATEKSTDLIVPMIKRAIAQGIRAKYLLMDSWFGFPSIILKAKKHIDVICMVKNTPKIFYYENDKTLTLSGLYKSFRKRRGRANIKGSRIVEIEHEGQKNQVKIVFIRNRNKQRAWLAILSTDIHLSDEDIVRIYGKRWDIEVFFKMAKQHLRLNNEIQIRNYDGMIAHISIVFLRYIFLTVEQRNCTDNKTFGGMFLSMIDEMKDITLVDSLLRLFNLVIEKIRTALDETNQFVDKMTSSFLGFITEKYGLRLNVV